MFQLSVVSSGPTTIFNRYHDELTLHSYFVVGYIIGRPGFCFLTSLAAIFVSLERQYMNIYCVSAISMGIFQSVLSFSDDSVYCLSRLPLACAPTTGISQRFYSRRHQVYVIGSSVDIRVLYMSNRGLLFILRDIYPKESVTTSIVPFESFYKIWLCKGVDNFFGDEKIARKVWTFYVI